ncbi:MAG: methyltransferase domain-containing protein [Chloroflexota bacterium]
MHQIMTDLDIDVEELRQSIRAEYKEVALNPSKGFHFHTGRNLTPLLGYDDDLLTNVPESAIESFAGTGNPFTLGEIKLGERVVDVACGAGIDSFIAANKVGKTGYVIGVDMTSAMVQKARQALARTDLTNLEFCHGYSEDLPVDDEWADVVILNGALNLMPDKNATLQEMARVLKPGGRLQLADILVDRAVSLEGKQQIHLWTGCIAGALMESELEEAVLNAGFVDFEITWRDEVFDGAPQASSAANFGTVGITFRARKPFSFEEWKQAIIAYQETKPADNAPQPVFEADAFYDAGDAGCAMGPIDKIATLLNDLESGQHLEVRATDSTVPVDLLAWLSITGHMLVEEQESHFLIKRK